MLCQSIVNRFVKGFPSGTSRSWESLWSIFPQKILLFVEDDVIDQIAFERFAQRTTFPYAYVLVSSVQEAKEQTRDGGYFDAAVIDYLLKDGTAFDLFENYRIPLLLL